MLFCTFADSQHIISTLADTLFCKCRVHGSPNWDATTGCCHYLQNSFGGLTYSEEHLEMCGLGLGPKPQLGLGLEGPTAWVMVRPSPGRQGGLGLHSAQGWVNHPEKIYEK